MTDLLGQTPAVLPLDAGQQGEHKGAGRRPRLHPLEPARDPGHGLVESHANGRHLCCCPRPQHNLQESTQPLMITRWPLQIYRFDRLLRP
ncbi:hypothetical protein ACFTWJ_32135, partial [Streptomyces anthocyanicus]|uniref:hypothetical protein n=1 Tax=Streptomyces anthocyanicus TaxID=68174 RepID=UPI00362CAF9D